MAVKDDRKYVCLFGGGAIRGIAYGGVIKALEELEIETSTYGGSSVGSIIAALLAVGYDAKELQQIFLEVNFELFKDIQFGLGLKLELSKGEIFLDWVRDLIESKYYGEKYVKGENEPVTFKDLPKNLIIISTDLTNYGCKEFSQQATPDFEVAKAVRISCTMPGLMKPIEDEDSVLVDGDLQKSRPMWKLSPNCLIRNERVLEFRLEGFTEPSKTNVINYVNTVYSCMTAVATSFITELYAKNDKFDYVVLNTGDVLIVDFNLSQEKRHMLIDMGYQQTMAYFKNSLPAKKTDLLLDYKRIYSNIIKIKKLLDAKKILKAQNTIYELFTDLCDLNQTIDIDNYHDIKQFKEIFMENIKYPALFGKVSLKDEKAVGEPLNNLVSDLSNKIKELEGYTKTVSV